MTTDARLLDWLLDSDPAVRWQVERDLADAAPEVWEATRSRVATRGLRRGAAVEAGRRRAVGGRRRSFRPGSSAAPKSEQPGQPWVATTWALKDLREWGVDAAVLSGTAEKLAANSRWEYEDLPYWGGEVDVCINSYTLASGAWLGADVSALAAVVPRPPARRRWLELRGGGGRLGPLLVPLDAQRGPRHARLRADHRRHQPARGAPRWGGVPARAAPDVPGEHGRTRR